MVIEQNTTVEQPRAETRSCLEGGHAGLHGQLLPRPAQEGEDHQLSSTVGQIIHAEDLFYPP